MTDPDRITSTTAVDSWLQTRTYRHGLRYVRLWTGSCWQETASLGERARRCLTDAEFRKAQAWLAGCASNGGAA